jgi:hypothetical protein
VSYLRDLFKQSRIALKPGEGLTVALDEAEGMAMVQQFSNFERDRTRPPTRNSAAAVSK